MTKAAEVEKAVEQIPEKAGQKSPEKRRALGRGLEALLPGPRVVVGPAGAPAGGGGDAGGRAEPALSWSKGVPARHEQVELRSAGQPGAAVPTLAAPSSSQVVGSGGEIEIPHFVRNDKTVMELQGVVEAGGVDAPASVPPDPLLARDARNGAPGSQASAAMSQSQTPASLAETPPELRSAGQPGAAVPTQALAMRAEIPHFVRNDKEGVRNDHVGLRDDKADETISISAQAEGRIPGNLVANIPLDAIDKNPYQTRLIFEEDALQDLAYSIKQSGVVQPVVVRPGEEEGRFILVLGERRLRASKMAGKETIPAIVRRVSELQAAELTIIENMQREDLNCMEQAEAFRVLSKDFQLTQAQIAERVGVSRESVSNYMRLLKLPVKVQEYLIEGGLGFSEAKVLLQLENVEQLQRLADMAFEKSMNVEQLRDAVMRLDGYLDPKPGLDPNEKPGEKKRKGGARWIDPNVRAAQVELQSLLGMRVRIRDRKGKGKIVIEYATVDDYERVVGMLRRK